MAHLLEGLVGWIEALMLRLGYIGVALIMLVENLFPPIPSEIVMPLAGFMAARGEFSFFWAVLAGTVGSVLGALALYYVGRLAGEPLVRPFIRSYGRWFLLSEADLDQALKIFQRHGDLMVFSGRVIPLVRSLISLPAGMNRMPIGRFLLLTTLGSAVWTTMLSGAGFLLGSNWSLVVELISDYQKVVLAVIVVGTGYFTFQRLRSLRRNARASSSD